MTAEQEKDFIIPNTVLTDLPIRDFYFVENLTPDGQAAIITCPWFALTAEEAVRVTYEIHRCPEKGCKIQVRYNPFLDELRIRGLCLK